MDEIAFPDTLLGGSVCRKRPAIRIKLLNINHTFALDH